ncbi:unnamed protein product [Blepharisma stoltei]|uniref:Response regulatory domain-containing protein n=1 Tax=Blepharisma stoltei TaxID=1481888 RepID=A0AAU9J4V7_9CILI|nr:unnamed protein product [Blepharisma stoltei]
MGTNYKYSIGFIYKQSPFLYYENKDTESKFQSEIFKYSWTSLKFFFSFIGSLMSFLYLCAMKECLICVTLFFVTSGLLWYGRNYKIILSRLAGLIIGLVIEISLTSKNACMLGYFVDWVIHYYTYKTWISYIWFYLLFLAAQIIHGIELKILQSIIAGLVLTLVMSLLEKDRRDLWLLLDIYRAKSIFQSFIIDDNSNSIMIIGEDGKIIMTNDAAIAFADKKGVSCVLKAHITEFFSTPTKETINKLLKNALEGSYIEEELILDSTPFLIKAKLVNFNHRPAVHFTLSDISNQISRRNFITDINNAQELKVAEVEKRLTECFIHKSTITENDFAGFAQCISHHQMTKAILQCLIGDVNMKNDVFNAEVEAGNIIQWLWYEGKNKKLNITLSQHPDLSSPIFCDRRFHNNLFKGVIHFIILKADWKSDIAIYLGKITHENETYITYSFTFDSQTLDADEFSYLFNNDPSKIKQIEDLHEILKKYNTIELAMFDIMLTILGGQIINQGPQRPSRFNLVYSLKLQSYNEQTVMDIQQIKLYENSADIDSSTITWRWSQEKTGIIRINRDPDQEQAEKEAKEASQTNLLTTSYFPDHSPNSPKLASTNTDNTEGSEYGEDDVDENVTIYGLSQYLHKETDIPGKISPLPMRSSSLFHISNSSFTSDFHVSHKGFLLIGNKFVANSLKKNIEAILGKDVDLCGTQEELVSKVIREASEMYLCIVVVDVPANIEVIKKIRNNETGHRKPYVIAIYSNNEEGNIPGYKEIGVDEAIPKSSGREILQSIIAKIL